VTENVSRVKKKNLLIIIPNLGPGGAQKVFHQQLQFLSAQFNVWGCVFNRSGFLPVDMNNDRILSLDVPAGKNIPEKVTFFRRRIKRLRDLKRKLQIDLAISHLEGADYVNYYSRLDEKVVCWVHGTKRHDRNIRGGIGLIRAGLLMPAVYGNADRVVAVSMGIADELRKAIRMDPSRLRVVYNGFDVEAIRRSSQASIDAAFMPLFSGNVLVTHCRLAPQKNLKALIALMPGILAKEQVRLVILGDGDLRHELIEYARSIGLKVVEPTESLTAGEWQVCFAGYQDNPYPFLRYSTIFMMTSLWEGFPLALCEAMACGLPVVAADCFTGPREILAPAEEQQTTKDVKGPFGVLMPLVYHDQNPSLEAWATAVVGLLRDEKRRSALGELGQKRVRHFDLGNSIAQTVTILQEL
jgi:glycosyltransferase involved in cell wall biosynthesis